MDNPTKRDVKQHIRNRWKRLKHVTKFSKDFHKEILTNMKKDTLIKSIYKKSQQDKFNYIINPQCIVDSNDRTLVHLTQLNNDNNAIEKATQAVEHYYFHLIKEDPSHRSTAFWRDLVEHFGAYISYNPFPYTSSDMASSHNLNHLKCVNVLIKNLIPLSESVNKFIRDDYRSLYEKLGKLSLGPFVPKPFGIFPMMAINFNTISDYHWDKMDEANSLCIIVPLGDFEGGELHFPQLKIVVKLKSGQAIAFPSRLLLHGNFSITKGIRYSLVYYVHAGFFRESYKNKHSKKNVKNQDLFKAPQNLPKVQFTEAKNEQIKMPPVSLDTRRKYVDLSRARRGLKAEDPISNN